VVMTPLQLNMRVAASRSSYYFICTARNDSTESVRVDDIGIGGNGFFYIYYDDATRSKVLSPTVSAVTIGLSDPRNVVISAKSSRSWTVGNNERRNIWYQGETGRYISLIWLLEGNLSPSLPICFLDVENNITPPVVDPSDPTAKPILAFVFNENQTNELGFVFLNGSNETVTVEKPLTQASRIVATAPAIEYTKELFIAGQPSENIAIEAGNVGEWRIPWQTIYDLIPAADLTAIKAAGGDLDLVWKAGEFQSDPLPISLAEPEPN
jgi:hypothetical protein